MDFNLNEARSETEEQEQRQVHIVGYHNVPCPHCEEDQSIVEMHDLSRGRVVIKTLEDQEAAQKFVQEIQERDSMGIDKGS